MKEYYIYEMHDVLSPTGKPYVGSSCNFYIRAAVHKTRYKLKNTPELIPISGPYYSKKEAWHAEQPYRVANGWQDEREASSRGGKHTSPNGGKIGGPIGGKISSQIDYICPYCGKTGKGNPFKGYHINKKKCITKNKIK